MRLFFVRSCLLFGAPSLHRRVQPRACDGESGFLSVVPRSELVQQALSEREQDVASRLQTRLGLSDAEIVTLLVRYPGLLDMSYERNLAPTIGGLQRTLGLDDDRLRKVVQAAPSALGLNSEGTLLPRIKALRTTLRLAEEDAARLVARYPQLLINRVESKLEPMLRALRELLCVTAAEARSLVIRYPQIVSLSVDTNLLPSVASLRDALAIDHAHRRELGEIVLALPTVLGLSIEKNVAPKLSFLASALRWSPDVLRREVRRCPAVLGASLEKSLRPNVQMWLSHLSSAELAELTEQYGLRFLCCSFQRRSKPRMALVLDAGLPAATLVTKLRLTDVAFDDWILIQQLRRAGSVGNAPSG